MGNQLTTERANKRGEEVSNDHLDGSRTQNFISQFHHKMKFLLFITLVCAYFGVSVAPKPPENGTDAVPETRCPPRCPVVPETKTDNGKVKEPENGEGTNTADEEPDEEKETKTPKAALRALSDECVEKGKEGCELLFVCHAKRNCCCSGSQCDAGTKKCIENP